MVTRFNVISPLCPVQCPFQSNLCACTTIKQWSQLRHLPHQVHNALDVEVELPGGYATTRRAALKAVALAGGLGSVYVLLTRAKVCVHILSACTGLSCRHGSPGYYIALLISLCAPSTSLV